MVAANEVPLWATILIGLVGGVLGTLVGTALTISHERGAEFRTRMLTAGDEYLQTIGTFIRRATDAVELLQREEPAPTDDIDALIKQLDDLRWELLLKLARINLLFEEDSPTLATAGNGDTAVEQMVNGIKAGREAGTIPNELDKAADNLANALNRFGTDVRRDVRRTGLIRQT